jgi:hypothetical protein
MESNEQKLLWLLHSAVNKKKTETTAQRIISA